jgi:hypothetical protein
VKEELSDTLGLQKNGLDYPRLPFQDQAPNEMKGFTDKTKTDAQQVLDTAKNLSQNAGMFSKEIFIV